MNFNTEQGRNLRIWMTAATEKTLTGFHMKSYMDQLATRNLSKSRLNGPIALAVITRGEINKTPVSRTRSLELAKLIVDHDMLFYRDENTCRYVQGTIKDITIDEVKICRELVTNKVKYVNQSDFTHPDFKAKDPFTFVLKKVFDILS